MNHVEPLKTPTRRRGIALVVTVSVLALATILLLAMFSVTESEYKSTQSYAAGQTAKLLGEDAVNLVISQIQSGSQQDSGYPGREFHATQPGLVRRYTENGAFYSGHKLYSDSRMTEVAMGSAGETALTDDLPPTDWNSSINIGRYVDLNEPAVTADAAGNVRVLFPIVDPRAFMRDPNSQVTGAALVEGFSYSDKLETSQGGNAPLNGVVLPTGGAGDGSNLRLPMPVEWIYVLKDGTMGTLDAGRTFVGSGGARPSAQNPIVGRFAFWTDDESCKVNINTASEPTYWGLPITYHERAHLWAERPPTIYEYQRFPGHPATVALSTIFYPNQDLDQYGKPTSEVQKIIDMKEAIYQIIPKINNGGSIAGTVPFAPDDLDRAQAEKVNIADSIRERLYASLDELLFSQQFNGTSRTQNDLRVQGQPLITPAVLERSRFFLTANSRSPEFSMMGVPRVAMWPVADESLLQSRRTIYDKLIAFCATLDSNRQGEGGQTANTYFFRRKDAHSSSTDVNLTRNKQLLDYLYSMMSSTYPRGTLGSGSSFLAKYGEKDTRQIVVSIFDYVRSTNLYDGFLAEKLNNLRDGQNGVIDSPLKAYTERDKIIKKDLPVDNKYNTYTEPRYRTKRVQDDSGRGGDIPDVVVADKAFPGHGQVSPSHWRVGTETYMGYARSVTVSEAALHFICTADGKNDDTSFRMWEKVGASWVKGSQVSGGRSAPRIKINQIEQVPSAIPEMAKFGPTDVPEEEMKWYSNYPPFPARDAPRYGADPLVPKSNPKWAGYHPGYNPQNWNLSLPDDTPLAQDEKRIQACLQLELFCPSVGWGKLHPELTFVLDGTAVSAITVSGQSIFSTTGDLVVKSEGSKDGNDSGVRGIFEQRDASPSGGTASFKNLVVDKRVHTIGRMSADPDYNSGAGGGEHANMANLDLVSSFITVKRDQYMTFTVPRPIKLDIYDDHDWQGREPIQTINLTFPVGPTTVMTPDIVCNTTARRDFYNTNGDRYLQRAIEAPRWWAFNWAGAVNRYKGDAEDYLRRPENIKERIKEEYVGDNIRCCGRLRIDGRTDGVFEAPNQSANNKFPTDQQFIYGASPTYNLVKNKFTDRDNPKEHYGTDVVRSIIPKYGDYRLIAARRVVPGDMWVPHPLWDYKDIAMAHNLTSADSDREPGFDRSGQPGVEDDPTRRLVKNTNQAESYENPKIPDMPHTPEAAAAAARYRDFDNAVGPTRDGAYINKPDEGNFSARYFWIQNATRLYRNAYFHKTWETDSAGDMYFTPNRMIQSPVMFGSLPTGVFGGQPGPQADAATHGVPWRTLLFRPDVTYPSGGASHAGMVVPRDHYVLDLFFMPVVEPYAISEPLSVAGRINVNYQIMPFTHIRRATGLHAVLKGELMNAVPKKQGKNYLKAKDPNVFPQKFWEENRSDKAIPNDQIQYFHRKINIAETLKQLDERFNLSTKAPADGRGLLRSASQFCEIHLIPADLPSGAVAGYANANINIQAISNDTTRKQELGRFWEAHALTGDNMRERPYANIYPRITSRTNTFRVHVRAQSIRKARSTDPAVFVPEADSVLSEYRGSTLIERYIDPNDTRIPEYADGTNPLGKPPLDSFYRFRVLENKRFVP
ncbi:Verru_Chthon cassette protein A [Roseimicrobium sp. ORNL1]|uniref:Verru_Chthon cassette protein A n=1 Tax=Roseimicrobium sp. ORNL1 TaxID=2711231 RepID=UPI0013E1BA64|nr:Verru_Chthon cassette protein A [Roseimicrobium sp. ORNL1]QIF01011.1 Verru_Chthon cassette protein A [Roseimicrobium sp. ORNL1]